MIMSIIFIDLKELRIYLWICNFNNINKFIVMSMIDKETLRSTHLAEADAIRDKQRHGFFSVPISTAIGDDG